MATERDIVRKSEEFMLKTDKLLKKIMKLMDKYREEATKLGFDHQATIIDNRRVFTHIHNDEVEIHLFDQPDHIYTHVDEQEAFREVKASDIDYVQNVLVRKDAADISIL